MDRQGNGAMNAKDFIVRIKSRDGWIRLVKGWMVKIVSWEKETCGNYGAGF